MYFRICRAPQSEKITLQNNQNHIIFDPPDPDIVVIYAPFWNETSFFCLIFGFAHRMTIHFLLTYFPVSGQHLTYPYHCSTMHFAPVEHFEERNHSQNKQNRIILDHKILEIYAPFWDETSFTRFILNSTHHMTKVFTLLWIFKTLLRLREIRE